MTSRQKRVLAILTLAVIAGIALILTADLWRGSERPQDDITPRRHESVPRFTSCAAASQAGVPLPMQVGDPGWNPRLDHDKNGLAC